MNINTILNLVARNKNIECTSYNVELSMSNTNMIMYTNFNIDGSEYTNSYKMSNITDKKSFIADYKWFLNNK